MASAATVCVDEVLADFDITAHRLLPQFCFFMPATSREKHHKQGQSAPGETHLREDNIRHGTPMRMDPLRTPLRYLACLVWIAVITGVCYAAHVNATTAALAMLLLVLGAATRWGFRESVVTSAAAMLAFNYFFLPPVGSFTIADSQNWIALCAFLITAVVVSRLSARAKAQTREALVKQREIERLYQLSRAMLMDEFSDLLHTALIPAAQIFSLEHITFYDTDSKQITGPAKAANWTETDLVRVASSGEPVLSPASAIIPVRLGNRIVGSLALSGPPLGEAERDSIANLIAIAYERARALDRAAAAEAARQGEKLKTLLLDGIAHNLKTPLTAIKTCVTTLLTVPPQNDEQRLEMLSIISEEANRLQHTITEAVQLARIESGKITLERRPVCMRDLFRTTIAALGDSERYQLSVDAELVVQSDPDLLSEAIRQLLENSHKYAAAATPIEIRAAMDSGSVLVQVFDRGPGISPSEINRIFEKYFRGTRARQTVQGTGMGLAIAKGIIEAHGGGIWAENRPGGGAIFSFQLPLT